MDRGKMPSSGRGGKSKGPQHPQDIFALGTKSTVAVSRDSEKRGSIHKPSTSGVERKRETSAFGAQPPSKRSRIGSPAEAVGGTSLEVDPVDLVSSVLQALDTHNSDKLLGLLSGAIRLLKSQRSKPDPILCMSLLYLTKIRPNMFAHETVTNILCTLLKREQGAAFKNKGNPLVFVLACNILYAGHRDNSNWPDIFIKVYIEDALNERWWVECSWCKCLVENIVTAFGTKQPPAHLIPTDNTLGTMSPSGAGSPMGNADDDPDLAELDYSVFPRYSSSQVTVEHLVLAAINEQIQRRSAAPDNIGKGFLKLLAATCGFPEIRMLSAARLEGWLNSGKLWRAAQELLAHVCVNCDAAGATAARDHEVLAQLARMRLKTKPLQHAYQNCLREMVSESGALLRSVVTHTIYNELSNVRSPNNMAVLGALIHAQPAAVPAAMAHTYMELMMRPEEYLRPLRALTRECVRGARTSTAAGGLANEGGVAALLPLARALASPSAEAAAACTGASAEVRERAFLALADLFCLCCLVTASAAAHARSHADQRTLLTQVAALQAAALGWLLDHAVPQHKPSRQDFQLALNKIMFVETAETYSKVDNWPPESERTLLHRLCCEAPLPQYNLLRIMFIGLSKELPVASAEIVALVEQLVRRVSALPPEDNPLQVDKLETPEYLFQLCAYAPPENISLPAGYTPPPLAITTLYWRAWVILTMIAAHNPLEFAERAAATYPTLRALIETCITNKPSIEWNNSSAAETEAEKAAILQLETHLAAASNAKLPVTEHTSRLLSQLTTMEPQGPARKPPAGVVESLQTLSSALRLGKLLCRQPALLLELVERHGTRRAMPWLHRLLRQDRLELSVLPVQCLCEFLSAGGGAGGAGEGKAGELCAHLRRTLHETEDGARAVLHYYTQRLAHSHAPTRAQASRGLKLVLTETEDATEMDYNADVSPEDWLDLLWELPFWECVRGEVVARIRAACLVECVPRHLAAYIGFLARHAQHLPHLTHADIVLELSQVLMERTTVMARVVGTGEPVGHELTAAQLDQHRTLHSLTTILYDHLQKVRSEEPDPNEELEEGVWADGERVTLQWPSGRKATLHVVVAHAHLKLLCLGPSAYDTNQNMYSWLQNVWVGTDAPPAFAMDSHLEAVVLPDWLRLHLVRSARPPLLAAGLRGLPAPKLALFIQTFGMPRTAMSALLAALDACPASCVARLGVERGYMSQLLSVQRARGATGGAAFAAALQLQPTRYPPDDDLFADKSLPEENVDDWDITLTPAPLQIELVPSLLSTAFAGATSFAGDLDTAFTQLVELLTEEIALVKCMRNASCPYLSCVITFLQACACGGGPGGLLARGAHAAAMLRTLASHPLEVIAETAATLLQQCKGATGPVVTILKELSQMTARIKHESTRLPPNAPREQLVEALETATPSNLEEIGSKIIESQDSGVIVDVITHLLEKNQEGFYESKIKTEFEYDAPAHMFSSRGRGCGLLLDWLSELQRENNPERLMRLMFGKKGRDESAGGKWVALLVTLHAHRASCRALHGCLASLLTNTHWCPTAVLDFAETLVESPRVWQGRDRHTPKHARPRDTLRLSYKQLEVLVHYIQAEAATTHSPEEMRRSIERRLPLLLRCCRSPGALTAASLAAAGDQPMLLLLLHMKVPKIRQLLYECGERPPTACPLEAAGGARGAVAGSTHASDRVSHAVLSALPHHTAHAKDHDQKVMRLDNGIRALWSRCLGAGARALPLAAALLRGALPLHAKQHAHLLAALEALPDEELFTQEHSAEIHSILEAFLTLAKSGGKGGGGGALMHRVAALLRRYMQAHAPQAIALMAQHASKQSHPALSALQSGELATPLSAAPPPQALLALQRRNDTPDNLHWHLQEIESWGSRRGGAWGGPQCAASLLRAVAPLAAAPHAPLRSAALNLLAKILPAVTDTKPGLQAILECLDSSLPEVTQSALDKLPDLLSGMQEHAVRVLLRVFELGLQARHPVEPCLTRCVVALNIQRGC